MLLFFTHQADRASPHPPTPHRPAEKPELMHHPELIIMQDPKWTHLLGVLFLAPRRKLLRPDHSDALARLGAATKGA